MHTLENNRAAEMSRSLPSLSEQKQTRLMRIALGLLFASLVVVTAKNWDFWSNYFFPDDQVAESLPAQPSALIASVQAPPLAATPRLPVPSRSKTHRHIKDKPVHANTAISQQITTANRSVLPPLEIDVVAGNRHQEVQANKRSVQVDMQPSEDAGGNGVTNASEHSVLSSSASEVVKNPVEPNYPVLAKEMKVQGAVILQALIGKAGNIQNLRVLSGPAILSEAARQAVRQWHFKPYYLSGQAVETEARITVNFTISTD